MDVKQQFQFPSATAALPSHPGHQNERQKKYQELMLPTWKSHRVPFETFLSLCDGGRNVDNTKASSYHVVYLYMLSLCSLLPTLDTRRRGDWPGDVTRGASDIRWIQPKRRESKKNKKCKFLVQKLEGLMVSGGRRIHTSPGCLQFWNRGCSYEASMLRLGTISFFVHRPPFFFYTLST